VSVRWEWYLTGDVGAEEMLESSGVVEVEVAHYDGFDVLDIIAGRFDGVWELHLLGVDGAWEEIGEWRTPFLFGSGQSTVTMLLSGSVGALTISTSSAQPVSNRIKPICGCSIRTAMMIKSRASFSGFLLLELLLLAPRRSLWYVRFEP
jgi:hypothetical protein